VNGVFTNSVVSESNPPTSFNSQTNTAVNEESLNYVSNVTQSDSSSSTLLSKSSRPQSDRSYSHTVVRNPVNESVLDLHSVPEVSYSSSDDDDFYYDAPEETSVIANPVTKQVNEVSDNLENMNL